MGNNTDLTAISAQVGLALQERHYLLALAESCTGGLAAASITDIAGSSAWFDRGYITYSNTAKQEMLSVTADTIAQYGAVSEQTAIAMAKGALQHSQADIAVSITGIAGPSGGTAEKPVGTVCFAWVSKADSTFSTTEYFTGNRASIRQQAAAFAISGVLKHVLSV